MSAGTVNIHQSSTRPTGTLCLDPSDLRSRLHHSRGRERLLENLASHNLCLLTGTTTHGHSFWQAVASQLERLRLPRKTTMGLRRDVIQFMKKNTGAKGSVGANDVSNFVGGDIHNYCDRIAKDEQWADHVAIFVTAKSLQRDIYIVTSCHSPNPNDCISWIDGEDGLPGDPLLIGHIQGNEYLSLQLKEEASRTIQSGAPGPRVKPSPIKNPRDVGIPAPPVSKPVPETTLAHRGGQKKAHPKRSHPSPSTQKSEGPSVLKCLEEKYSDNPPSDPDPEEEQSPAGGSARRLKRAQELITYLQEVLRDAKEHNNSKCLDTWSSVATSLGSEASLPSSTIGVVGESGHGKSSLLNALLDQTDILPTSGMKACTAVVIEVGDNDAQPMYEARIEFLSEEDWKKELELLWGTLKTQSDDNCSSYPDETESPEADVARCKVQAVYGKLSPSTTLEDLMKPNEVTKHLGKPIDIAEEEVDAFCERVDKYVKETADSEDGGEYWPVITKVSIRIPECKVCRDGIFLVDLPGSRDSNAARDIIAQENMKKLSHVLIVADITRAVTNKTAKDLLGEHFRRQMLMDGQYRNISVVCTKSDNIGTQKEIERDLKRKQTDLPGKLEPDKTAIQRLKTETSGIDDKRKAKAVELGQLQKQEKQLKLQLKDILKARSHLAETQFSGAELKQRDHMVDSLERKRQKTESDLEGVQTQLSTIQGAINGYKEEISILSTKIAKHHQSLNLICAKARNNFVCEEIHKDFCRGIQEMKQQAGKKAEIDVDQIAQKLTVFCVSSTDYQHLTMNQAEETRVYKEIADTEIPRLQEFLQELGEEPRRRRTEQLLRCLHQLLSDIKGHLSDSGTKDSELRGHLKTRIEVELHTALSGELHQLVQTYSNHLQSLFDILFVKLTEGTGQGKAQALDICQKWGRPPDKKNRKAGGLTQGTYKAVCRRGGVYKSAALGNINFNDELSGPLYREISIAWDKVFNVKLGSLLNEFTVNISAQIKEFTTRLENEFPEEASRLAQFGDQVTLATEIKIVYHLTEVALQVVQRQREISRQISPIIQKEMRQTYSTVGEQSGRGSFNRMKEIMENGVKVAAYTMYDEAATHVKKELLMVQTAVVQGLEKSVMSLLIQLRGVYELLWESPTSITKLKTLLDKDVDRLLARVRDISKEVNVKPGQQGTVTQKTSASQPRKRRISTNQEPQGSQGPPAKK